MDGEQAKNDQGRVQRDRKERGEQRDSHLDAAREQARRANAQARERSQAGLKPERDEATTGDEAQSNAGGNANEAAIKAQARIRYEGTDEDFEQEWPEIRERLVNEDMQKGVERIRRRL